MKPEIDEVLALEGQIHVLELVVKTLIEHSGFVPAQETIEGLRQAAEAASRQRAGSHAFRAGADLTLEAIFGDGV